MKKKFLIAAAVVLALAIAAGGTLAFFTSRTVVHNVITSGNIQIELEEKTLEDGVEVDFPAGGIAGVMPGTTVDKIVRVKNTGIGDAWIRVQLEGSIVSAQNKTLPVDVMIFTVEEGWIAGEDGYYYYENVVPSGEYTAELIKTVDFAASMGNEYQNCIANLIVSAEAVQVANNGDTVLEAAGWPN